MNQLIVFAGLACVLTFSPVSVTGLLAAAMAETSSVARVVIETEMGDIEVALDTNRAPATCANFLKYVDAGSYSNGTFHRAVKPGNQPTNSVKIEVVQGAANRVKPEFSPVILERTSKTGLKHLDGTISMARLGPDSATHEFFICLGDQPSLDFGGRRHPDGQGFAAFGRVVRGLEVARKIQAAAVEGQKLTPPIKILNVRRVTSTEGVSRGYSLPLIDLSGETNRHVVVDREPGQYLGHPTTVLLEDSKTMLIVYPKGHGRGEIVMKRSTDAGLTWSERLPVPENWSTSRETPTIHRVIDANGKKRLILFSGLYPCRMAVSEDDGVTWSPLTPVGDWGGIVTMGFVEKLRTEPGEYLAMFHDDGRYFSKAPQPTKPPTFTLYQTFSRDGGLTWSFPEAIQHSARVHLCEPGLIRSPDGKEMAVLLRENSRQHNSHVIFSRDEGRTWTAPRELPGALTGDRHVGKYAPDGRLFISFRDTTLVSPTKGDWVGWVGTYDDIAQGREGQYRVRLMQNHSGRDCAYPGVEVLPDGTLIATTYGHWVAKEQPFIVSVRFRLEDLDVKGRRTDSRKPGG